VADVLRKLGAQIVPVTMPDVDALVAKLKEMGVAA
jgi:hypothetical protein